MNESTNVGRNDPEESFGGFVDDAPPEIAPTATDIAPKTLTTNVADAEIESTNVGRNDPEESFGGFVDAPPEIAPNATDIAPKTLTANVADAEIERNSPEKFGFDEEGLVGEDKFDTTFKAASATYAEKSERLSILVFEIERLKMLRDQIETEKTEIKEASERVRKARDETEKNRADIKAKRDNEEAGKRRDFESKEREQEVATVSHTATEMGRKRQASFVGGKEDSPSSSSSSSFEEEEESDTNINATSGTQNTSKQSKEARDSMVQYLFVVGGRRQQLFSSHRGSLRWSNSCNY
jgi:hypothetical protein